jgi:cytochrome d ubiquinol oxidase subunit II
LGNVVRGVPLDAKGVFFEPLWTDFRVGNQTGIVDWYTLLAGITAVAALVHHGALWLTARTEGPIRMRANHIAAPLGAGVICLFAALDLASFTARLDFRDAIRSRPWGMFFPALTLGGLIASMVWRKHDRPGRAYLSSSLALFAAFATAAVGIFPNILPARDPRFSLTIYDNSVSHDGLATALWWWIPGILLVVAYFSFIYTQLGKRIKSP